MWDKFNGGALSAGYNSAFSDLFHMKVTQNRSWERQWQTLFVHRVSFIQVTRIKRLFWGSTRESNCHQTTLSLNFIRKNELLYVNLLIQTLFIKVSKALYPCNLY